MAGRNNGRFSNSNSATSLRAPPSSATNFGKASSSAYGFGSHSIMDMLSGNGSAGLANIPRGDKTVCQCCGVSYLTISEMKTLQTRVKEQEEKLIHYRSMMEENSKLKESLEASRRESQRTKSDSAKQKALEKEIDDLKKQLRESKVKNTDLAQKYTIANDDSKQQEEVISSLREDLNELRETQAQNATLQRRVNLLRNELEEARSRSSEIKLTKENEEVGQKDSAGDVGRDQNQNQEDPEPELPLQRKPSKAKATPSNCQETIEIYDLKKMNGYLTDKIRSVTDEHAGCQSLHSFLRETVDKLKTDNEGLHDDINALRMKFQQAELELENVEAKCQGLSNENERLRQNVADIEEKYEAASEQYRILVSAQDPSEIEELQQLVSKLERNIQEQRSEMEQMSSEHEKRLSDQQRETTIEKERADSCLREMITEREEVEKRWEDRWNRHQTSLNEQLDSLKTYYEQTLETAKEIEEGLQRDLKVVKGHFDKNKDEWEACRADLNAQVTTLKAKLIEKSDEMDSLQKAKIMIEVMLQDKNEELDLLQEMVRGGCEERQELQKKVEQLEQYIEETRKGNLQRRPSLLFQQHRASEGPSKDEINLNAEGSDSYPALQTISIEPVSNGSTLKSILKNSTSAPAVDLRKNLSPESRRSKKKVGSSSSSSKESLGSSLGKRKQLSPTASGSAVLRRKQREAATRLSTPKGNKSAIGYSVLARKSK